MRYLNLGSVVAALLSAMLVDGSRSGAVAAQPSPNPIAAAAQTLARGDQKVKSNQVRQLDGDSQKLALQKVASVITLSRLSSPRQELESLQLELEKSRKSGNLELEAEILNKISAAHVKLKQFKEAVEASQQALSLYKQLKTQEGELNTIGNIANIYFKFGKPQDAERVIRQKIQEISSKQDKIGNEIFTKVLSRYLKQEWRFSAGYGMVSDSNLQEDYRRGKISWQDVLDLSRFNLFVSRIVADHQQEIESLHGMGWAYRNLGDFPSALDYYNQAVTIAKLRSERFRVIFLLVEIGIVYSDLGSTQQGTRTISSSNI